MKVRDPLGNEIKENALVMISYNDRPTLARVMQLSPPGMIGSREGMTVPGTCVLQIIVPLNFQGEEIGGVWVLQHPSNQELAAKAAAEKLT